MDKTKKYLTISFIVVLIAVIIISAVGMLLLKKKPVILQGQIESTEIRISGKLPGRIDTFLVKEGRTRGRLGEGRRYACRHQQSGSNG